MDMPRLKSAKKDVIISGGESISSLEIEQVLDIHPKEIEAAVVAMADYMEVRASLHINVKIVGTSKADKKAHLKTARTIILECWKKQYPGGSIMSDSSTG